MCKTQNLQNQNENDKTPKSINKNKVKYVWNPKTKNLNLQNSITKIKTPTLQTIRRMKIKT